MTTEERLEALEQKVAHGRFINRLLATLFTCVFVFLWFFAPRVITAQEKIFEEVRAKKFILVDESNKPRALLGMLTGGPCLMLFDDKATARAALSIDEEAASLNLKDVYGNVRTVLAVTKSGPLFSLYDQNSLSRASLYQIEDVSCLAFFDVDHKTRISISTNELGPAIRLSDKNGVDRAGLGVSESMTNQGKKITNPESSFSLCGPDGMVIWEAP